MPSLPNSAGLWSARALLQSIAARGQEPAVIVSSADGFSVTTSEALVRDAMAVAHSLRRKGIGRGEPIALWAPNSPSWIAAALGIMAAGAVLVPIDDLFDDLQLGATLRWSGARLIVTSARHLKASADVLRAEGVAFELSDL